jgi:hypothetical protein
MPAMPPDDAGAKLWTSGASDVTLSVASCTKQVSLNTKSLSGSNRARLGGYRILKYPKTMMYT